MASNLGVQAQLLGAGESRRALAPVPLRLQPLAAQPFTACGRRARALMLRARAEEGGAGAGGEGEAPTPAPRRRRNRRKKEEEAFTLDKLNPISMGRKSREVFDDVWAQLQRLGGGGSSRTLPSSDFRLEIGGEFEAPQAPNTTVLVAGATGRVGRILVRKLLLRGYKVRALVRNKEKEGAAEALPQSVEVVEGDIADYKACRRAVEGVDKVVCCAAARTTLTAELNRVEVEGVYNLCKAMLDARFAARGRAAAAAEKGQAAVLTLVGKPEVVDFSNDFYHEHWDIEKVGVPDNETRRRVFDRGQDRAEAYINEDDNLVFEGAVYSRGGVAQVGAPLVVPPKFRQAAAPLAGTEGLLLNFKGDGNSYVLQLETEGGHAYCAKFSTPSSTYGKARLPFDTFIPAAGQAAPPLDPTAVRHISIRYEPRVSRPVVTGRRGDDEAGSPFDRSGHAFKLELDWIKAMPAAAEPDFVLVSCAGRRPDLSDASRAKLTSFKARGEETLRSSGLSYTVVRPGPLREEAGGYKALVFDQGNRIREAISCADVADVCLKALHDPLACNKTFEVCWEFTPEEGLEQYELVAHLPDKANSYLTPALATLRKNT